MKRIGNIFEKIVSDDNLAAAIEAAAKGKMHRRIVRDVIANKDKCVKIVKHILINDKWRPAKCVTFDVCDPVHKKVRKISMPQWWPDLIVQWAIMQQVEPILNRGLFAHSYCNIKGKGNFRAANYTKRCLRDIKGTKYCLKMDIQKYYQNVNGDILKTMLRRVIKCPQTLRLLDLIIDVHKGLPIGNYTSQIFANFYLQGLDMYIKQNLNIKYYVRYMDDMIILGTNKRKMHRIRQQVSDYLATLGLRLNNKWQVYPVAARCVDFCGVASNHRNSHIRRSIFKRWLSNIKAIKRGKYNPCRAARYFAYDGWLKHTDSAYLYKKYLQGINIKKLRNIISNNTKQNYAIRKNRKWTVNLRPA